MSTTSPPQRMRHEYHKVPVTALAFYSDDILLSGEGTSVVAYNVSTRELLCSVKVFQSQTIHGVQIDTNSHDILIWGGSSLLNCRFDPIGLSFAFSTFQDVGDWILDAAFTPHSNGRTSCAALVTAHNALVKCSLLGASNAKTVPNLEIQTVVAGSNCILYCAQISWLSPSQCLIASGTAFGDVILWSSSPTGEQSDASGWTANIHYTFSAHEGSVFGVQMSSPLDSHALPGCSRALVTCSDDRTIRLYGISDLTARSPALVDVQRDTGFGSRQDFDAEAPPLLAKAMAHISRIWAVRFLVEHDSSTSDQSAAKVFSFGEDATRITWDIETSSDSNGSGTFALCQTRAETLHTGKNIWAVAMSGKMCATGGADGSIALLPAHARIPSVYEIPKSSIPPIRGEPAASPQDSFKSFALVSPATLIATTSKGQIVALGLFSRGDVSVQRRGSYESLKAYSVVTSCRGIGFTSGVGGHVQAIGTEAGESTAVTKMDGKTAGLFASKHADPKAHPSTRFLLSTSVGASTARLTDLRLTDPDLDTLGMMPSKSCSTVARYNLDLPPGLVVTSFTMIIVDGIPCAVLGSRNGSLVTFPFQSHRLIKRSSAGEEEMKPLFTAGHMHKLVPHVHGSDAVTSLHWIPHHDDETGGFLFSTGRDGTYAVHRVRSSERKPLFDLVHQLELPFGPNIEGLHITASAHLLVWGFRSKHFIVHDITTQRDIMSVDCGGAKRNWSFYPTEDGGTFVWTKASQVFWTTQTELPHVSINGSGHGREIKAVAVSPGFEQIIATGAEDTDIKLFQYNEQERFTCLQTLRKHSTGIQHLQWSDDGRYLFSSGGLEEFCVWRITPGVPYVGVGVACESVHPASGASDLRVMGFDARAVAGDSVDQSCGSCFDITMVYSDSAFKLWHYCNSTWRMASSGDYLTACLMDVVSMPSNKQTTDPECTRLTSASDGYLALWSQTAANELVWSKRHKVHQNAILSTLSEILSDGRQLLVTSGDDNGIGLTIMSREGDMATVLIQRAHAAAVTAVALIRTGHDRFWLCSASIDQRVKLWKITFGAERAGVEGLEVARVQTASTSVADISSMALISLEDGATAVLLCGVGMDLWHLPSIAP